VETFSAKLYLFLRRYRPCVYKKRELALTPESEIELVRELQGGSTEAFRQLYGAYKDNVYRYCFRMLGYRREEAEDVAQEAFMKVYRGILTLDHAASFKYWLYTIVRNEILLFRRRNHRPPQVQLDTEAESLSDNHTPHDIYVRQEQVSVIEHLLATLTDEQRETFCLREFEGFSYAEIAAVTDSTESAVRSRLFKARRHLAGQLGHLKKERTD